MVKQKPKKELELWEVKLIKAMLEHKKYTDQDILAYFTRPTRSVNHARISAIRAGQKHKLVNPASEEELRLFLQTWPQIDWNTGLHILGDERLIKAREAMLQAVQSYNNPRSTFKAEVFIVTAIIAWTYLLHAYYRNKGIDYRYYRNVNGQPAIVLTRHRAEKHWDLEDCITKNQCPLDEPTKANLRFLIEIRHEIKHQMTRRIDDAISAKLQACCLNFNRVLKELFGERFGLDADLSLALQFAAINPEHRNQLLKELNLPEHLVAMQTSFEDGLPEEVIKDQRYAYRVLFVETSVNSKGKADQVIKFVRANSEEGKEISRILIKETEKKKFKPAQIVLLMKKEGFRKFREHEHTLLWKALKARDPKKGLGVFLREGDWWWYESWIEKVRQHCQENKDRYT